MKIIHLSDLHFGTEQKAPLQVLINDMKEFGADIVVISGDLTQRAKKNQYQAALQFIQEIQAPVLAVPGNHDIPLYNLFMRLLFPFAKYKRWISQNLCTYRQFQNVAILGINSATPFKPMGGFVTDKQLKMVLDFFNAQPKSITKIIVMHHNLIRSERHKIINDADKIIRVFAKANVNLILSGHIHIPYIERLPHDYLSHAMYVITAGTAISERTLVPNSYNIIDILDKEFKLTVRDFKNDKFVTTSEQNFPL